MLVALNFQFSFYSLIFAFSLFSSNITAFRLSRLG